MGGVESAEAAQVTVASWDERGDAAEVDAGASAPPALVALRALFLGLLAGRAARLVEDEREHAELETRSQLDARAERLASAVLRALEAVESAEARERRASWRAFYAGLPAEASRPDLRTAHPGAPTWTSYERSHAAKVDAWEQEDARAYVLARVAWLKRREAAA